jgi:cytochrome P450
VSLIALADRSVRPEVLADPYRVYAKLRAQTPVTFDGGVNAWLVSRYDDVRALALDQRLQAGRSQSYFRSLPARERTRFELFGRTREAMLFYLDGPAHARVRLAVAGALHEAVAALGPALVKRHVEALVDRIAASRGEIDLVRDLAEPLPRLVLSDLLGLPDGEAATIYRQSVAYNSSLGGVIATRHVEQAEGALRELRPRLLAIADDAEPASILAALRAAVDAGDLTEDELVASAVALVAAGHETTTSLIANAFVALARNPSAQALVDSSETATRRVVDEVLRFEPPIQLTAREAGEELQIEGQTIRRGDRVLLLLASANRDPSRFERPDAFEPGRAERLAALSFGIGPHHCPGAGLARTQAEVAVRVLLHAVGSIRLSHEPAWKNSFTFRGPASVLLDGDPGRGRR